MTYLSVGGAFVLFLTEIIQAEVQYTCHCKTSCPSALNYNPTKPCPEGCVTGYYDMYCQTKNVALGKNAWQISTYSETLNRIGRIVRKKLPNTADKAVDGNANTFYSRRSCTHTGLNETAPYWSVNLGKVFTVNKIIIYQRSTFTERLTGFEVLVDNKLCYRWEGEQAPPIRIPIFCQQPIRGQNVTVRLPEKKSCLSQILTLCEVLILVCNDYWFGERCDKTCQCRDPEEICNPVTGYCNSGCASGDGCQQSCSDGKWGENCQRTCGHCKGGTPCIPQTGECVSFGCEAGWEGPACDTKSGQNPSGEIPEPIGKGTLSPTGDSQSPGDDDDLSSGDITAIFFGVLIVVFTICASILVYRRWRMNKASSSGDNRYDDLIRRPATSEHLYVGIGEVNQAAASEVKVNSDNEAKFTCSDDHYEYVGGCDGYLEPVATPPK